MAEPIVKANGQSDYEALGIKPPSQQHRKTAKDFVVWHDSQQSLTLFFLCQTQWRVGFSGATGLDYTAVLAVIALHEPKTKKHADLFAEVCALETGALKAFAENQKAAEEKAKKEK